MQAPAAVAESCSGTLEFLPDLVDVGERNCVVAHLDKPHKPEHSERQLSSQSFNLQYELVFPTPSRQPSCLGRGTFK